MYLGLKDVHVLVTGASGGIGLETAKLFLEQGAFVTMHYHKTELPAAMLANTYGSHRFLCLQGDLSREEDVRELFRLAAEKSPVQVLVINHAVYAAKNAPLKDMSLEQWNNTITQDLTSPFLVAREYLRQLEGAPDAAKAHASILFVGSSAGKFGEAGHADYAASKSALMYGLTKSLKNEIVKIAPAGRVNCVAPGWTRTALAEESLKNPHTVYQAMATTPLKKLAVPHDAATQIVLLSSSKVSGHVSGEVLMVHGGMEGRLLNAQDDVAGVAVGPPTSLTGTVFGSIY